jgi:DNA-binding LacI/PurR family transcriptional regulator
VPGDISVVAICPEDVALGQTDALTAVDLPAHTIGGVAVDMAIGRLTADHPAETRLLAPVLTTRTSTAPPR